MNDNEFLLFDRITKIKSVIKQYGEENFYLSFSGGKDSTVLSALLDMAIPGNAIPRVYSNTGIEYKLILDFVEKMRGGQHSWELIIIKPNVPIKQMLEKDGYPFKSKLHSRFVMQYQENGLNDISTQKYYDGEYTFKSKQCPKSLKYQFEKEMPFKISDKCCKRLKTEPIREWQKQNGKKYGILGLMQEEGGRRENAQCLAFRNGKLKNFQPLVAITKEWEDWFIKEYDIEISDIYKPPYNFVRTGCKACPYGLELQHELDILGEYFPIELKQCEAIWQPVYEEYRRLGFRLRKDETIEGQMTINDLFGGENEESTSDT